MRKRFLDGEALRGFRLQEAVDEGSSLLRSAMLREAQLKDDAKGVAVELSLVPSVNVPPCLLLERTDWSNLLWCHILGCASAHTLSID